MAPFGHAALGTNLSRSISLSVFDADGKRVRLTTKKDEPFEIIIPRDPSLIIPTMFRENVTQMETNDTMNGRRFFKYQQAQLQEMSSIHLELHPLNIDLSYLFVYYFDQSMQKIDGWAIFSPESNLKDLFLLVHSDLFQI